MSAVLVFNLIGIILLYFIIAAQLTIQRSSYGTFHFTHFFYQIVIPYARS
jgi:hypothetical protein